MQTTIEIRDRRANLLSQARSILDTAEASRREISQEEENQFNSLMAEATRLAMDIQRRDMRQSAQETRRPDPGGTSTPPPAEGRASVAYRGAFCSWLRGVKLQEHERRALQVDSGVLGGFLVAPMQIATDLIGDVNDQVFVRQWARKFAVTSAESLGVPALDTDVSDADWTTELGTGNEDTALSFGRRALHPHPLAKRIKISNKLLRQVLNVEELVRERMAYKVAVPQEKGFLTGDGAQKPLGVFFPSADGIPTTRDYSTGNTVDSIRFDGLIGAKFMLKGKYLLRGRWIFHRDAVMQLAKIKDGEGNYIWRESVRDGEPDRLLGLPYFMSEYAPNAYTAGKYVGILGDWGSGYWIADAYDVEFQRILELYAETNQVGLIVRASCDGMPVLAEAFVRIQLAS